MNISHIRFTIGTGKTKDGQSINPQFRHTALDAVRRYCAAGFGGWTETSANGGWFDKERSQLVIEQVVIFDCAIVQSGEPKVKWSGEDIRDAQKKWELIESYVASIIEVCKSQLNQDCVLVQYFAGTSTLA